MKISLAAGVTIVAASCTAAVLCSRPPDPLNFQTLPELQKLVAKHISEPRATYELIMRAYHQGLAPEITGIYKSWMNANPSNPELKSAYAFSYYWATGNRAQEHLSREKLASPLVTNLYPLRDEVERIRREAAQAAPDIPEILLETAVGEYNRYAYAEGPDAQVALARLRQDAEYLRQVIKLEPTWSDGYFYLGDLLSATSQDFGSDRAPLLREALADLQKAEQLDPAWRPECLASYALDYAFFKQNEKALACLDEWLKDHPNRAKDSGILQWRAYLARQVEASQK